MTNLKSRFTALTASGLILVALGAVIALIHWDLHRLIYAGDSKGFDFHLLLISIVCAIPGVVLAFLLGYFVRLGTNPKTNWILPSIVVGAGAAIVTRTVVNKVQAERKVAQQQKVFEARKAVESPQLPPAGAKRLKEFTPPNSSWIISGDHQQEMSQRLAAQQQPAYNQDLYEKVIRQARK